jgi:hypothetical protein
MVGSDVWKSKNKSLQLETWYQRSLPETNPEKEMRCAESSIDSQKPQQHVDSHDLGAL